MFFWKHPINIQDEACWDASQCQSVSMMRLISKESTHTYTHVFKSEAKRFCPSGVFMFHQHQQKSHAEQKQNPHRRFFFMTINQRSRKFSTVPSEFATRVSGSDHWATERATQHTTDKLPPWTNNTPEKTSWCPDTNLPSNTYKPWIRTKFYRQTPRQPRSCFQRARAGEVDVWLKLVLA